MDLAGRGTDFRQTGNPRTVIEAYMLAIQADCVPPPWVLETFHGWLGEWYEAAGKKTLDECFGLTRKQGQKQNALQRDRQRQRDGFLCFMVFFLQSCQPRLPVEASARLVVETFRLPPESDIENIGEATVKDYYDHEWSKVFEKDSVVCGFRDEIKQWTDEERRSFICAFRGGNAEADNLLPSKTLQMPCLTCRKPFPSTDRVNNRRCESCRNKYNDE